MAVTSRFRCPLRRTEPDARTIRPDDGAVKLDGANRTPASYRELQLTRLVLPKEFLDLLLCSGSGFGIVANRAEPIGHLGG